MMIEEQISYYYSTQCAPSPVDILSSLIPIDAANWAPPKTQKERVTFEDYSELTPKDFDPC
jgi:hypothetical protein